MLMLNVTKNLFKEIKTKLVEYECGSWKGSSDSRKQEIGYNGHENIMYFIVNKKWRLKDYLR